MEPHRQSPWYLHVLRRNPPKHTLLSILRSRLLRRTGAQGFGGLSSSHSSTAIGRGLLRRRIKGSPTPPFPMERIGASSLVTGGRALSFHHVSLGETAALSVPKGMRRGQNSPGDTWLEKTSPGASERKKRHQSFSGSGVHMHTLLNVSNI
jgi:hypothetical protein